MDQLLPVLLVTAFMAFILFKQINHIAKNSDKGVLQQSNNNNFKKYSNFSVSIQNYIRIIKNDLDSSKQTEEPIFKLLNNIDEKASLEELSDFLRKLVFFETLLAKQKTSEEIESELFAILDAIDSFIKTKCEDGEKLAQELKNKLFEEFQNA